MSSNTSNALVPVKNTTLPAVVKKVNDVSALSIVNHAVHLANKQEVRDQLPDILGRVLARIWIDHNFHRNFSENPQATLEANGVSLPDTMDVEFHRSDTSRPRIVVYERKPNSKFRSRIFYLQLVMMAGR